VAGHIPLVFESLASIAPYLRSGKLVPLAITSAERLEALPDVPTMKEVGYDFVVQGWAGLLLPAGTPQDIVDRLDNACRAVLEQADFRSKMTNQFGWEPAYMAQAEFGEFMKTEVGHWSKMLSMSTVKLE
jgi:tripartite-type tricarboxylate transporter receptor subunit TctC